MPINGIKALQIIFSAALMLLWVGCGSDNGNSAAAGSSSGGGCTPSLIGGRTTCPLTLSATVTTLAGNGVGNTDATGTAALFNQPYGITTDGTNLFVADYSNHRFVRL